MKPGGVLAIEQHRAKPGQDPSVFNGYLDEKYVISLAEKAGFKLAGKSEINANPKDTKDHPVRRVDAAADASVIGRRQAGRSVVRSRQVRRHRRVGSHDAALREARRSKTRLMKTIGSILLKGLVTILPIGLTVYFVYWLGVTTESLLSKPIKLVVGEANYLPGMG